MILGVLKRFEFYRNYRILKHKSEDSENNTVLNTNSYRVINQKF